MQLSDHQMGSGQYSEIAVMRRPPLAPTALNKLAQGRARNERRPGLLGPKRASPVRARQTVATFCHARFGACRICVYLPRALPWAGLSKAFGLYRRTLTKRWVVSSGRLWGNLLGMVLFHYCSA